MTARTRQQARMDRAAVDALRPWAKQQNPDDVAMPVGCARPGCTGELRIVTSPATSPNAGRSVDGLLGVTAGETAPFRLVPMPDLRPFERFPALSPELQDRADAEWRK